MKFSFNHPSSYSNGALSSSDTLTIVLPHWITLPRVHGMTSHPVTVYRHRTWHPTLSQYTETGHDITPCHSIQTQDMTSHPVTVYNTGHDITPCHSIQTQDMTSHPVTVYRHRTWHPTLSHYTDTGHDIPPCHSKQTQNMTPHPITVYRHRAWHPTLS